MLHGAYVGSWLGALAMRKKWIKVYLRKEQRRLLRRVAEGLGIGESEVLRQAFGFITETAHNCNKSKSLLTHEQALKILAGASLQYMAQAFNRKPDAIA